MTQALLGRHVLVTRPAGQATHLAEALVAEGAKPVLFPVLAIFPLTDTTALVDQIIRLDQYQLAIFISPNAVQMGLQEVLSRRAWPDHVRVATVGQSSEAALLAHDLGGQQHQILCPQGRFDSEALLELPELQRMDGRDVIIFRGDGGRELLADTLRQRGASVDYATCYRRTVPDLSPDPLFKLWGAGQLDAITATSSEGLHNLVSMVGPLGLAWLRKTPLFVPHARIVATAERLGMQEVVLTDPADAGLMAGLLRYFGHEH
jgi:uroporphyrinogen-III synthase